MLRPLTVKVALAPPPEVARLSVAIDSALGVAVKAFWKVMVNVGPV